MPTLPIALPPASVNVTVQAEPSLYFITKLEPVTIAGFLITLTVATTVFGLYLVSPE